MPNKAKGWGLGCLGWKSSHFGSSAKGFAGYKGAKIAVGRCLALSLTAGTSGDSLRNSASLF